MTNRGSNKITAAIYDNEALTFFILLFLALKLLMLCEWCDSDWFLL